MIKTSSKPITMKDIAKQCNVSSATVSRVLSDNGYPVNEVTRKLIKETAKRLKYVPNEMAQNLKRNFSNEIAVIIPTIANPFYTSLISGFESIIVPEGYNIILYGSVSEKTRPTILKSIASRRVRGVLVTSTGLDVKFAETILNGNFGDTKFVFADCTAPQGKINSVCFDYKKGMFIGTNYLIEKGHKKIVYAGTKIDRESRKLRLQGFKDAMEMSSIGFNEKQIVQIDDISDSDNYQLELGVDLAKKILELNERPTAIVAINDMVAFGILRHLRSCNISVPNEISVLGFDDNIFCEACTPMLTTIKVHDKQIGRMAAMLLLDDIKGSNGDAPVNLFLNPCIVERETVADIR